LIRQVKLFCSEACGDEAKLVRYARRCISDGRINQPDVQEAIQIRIAHALSGGYSERERRVLPSLRSAVIARDGGRCRKCGQPGTDIDHIHSSSNELDNLQLLCGTCHNKKTKARFVEITPELERYSEINAKRDSLHLRIEASVPQRPCDDEKKWSTSHLQFMTERREKLKKQRDVSRSP
jgi:5-methylcytosine-specific restriction endonuclease McrA